MNIEDFRKYCLSLPYTEERMPFEKFFRGKHSFLAFYVQGKMFCYFDIDRFDQCTIKCPPKAIEDLETNYQSVMRPYNLSPRNWIFVCFNRDVPGKLFADNYDFRSPRVQFGTDMAVLTYQLFANTTLIDMAYNCIEVYQKEADGEWHVIHSTWSFIRPMDMDFGKAKDVV